MTDLSFIDWCLCAVYLAVVFGLAVRSARGQQDNEDFFLGGRNMNWFVVGVSMFATSFSSISFLGLPQRGAYQDFSFDHPLHPICHHSYSLVDFCPDVRPA
jgi:SSS family solute:Na+ symporter